MVVFVLEGTVPSRDIPTGFDSGLKLTYSFPEATPLSLNLGKLVFKIVNTAVNVSDFPLEIRVYRYQFVGGSDIFPNQLISDD